MLFMVTRQIEPLKYRGNPGYSRLHPENAVDSANIPPSNSCHTLLYFAVHLQYADFVRLALIKGEPSCFGKYISTGVAVQFYLVNISFLGPEALKTFYVAGRQSDRPAENGHCCGETCTVTLFISKGNNQQNPHPRGFGGYRVYVNFPEVELNSQGFVQEVMLSL